MNQQARGTAVIQLYGSIPVLSPDDVASPDLFNLLLDCDQSIDYPNQNEKPSLCMADIVDLKTRHYSK